jgi:hypothetical protein
MSPASSQTALSVPAAGTSLDELLRKSIDRLKAVDFLQEAYADKLRGLQARLHEGRFHLAVLGQFKRGKSTFVNALLGAPVLPTAVVPLTALPTFLSWGEAPRAQVQFLDDRMPDAASGEVLETFLQAYVTEDGNPKNQKGVRQVDVWYPSPLLREGLVVIDTPGIGSTFRHNTEATLNFLPQCDASLFLVSADPPMTEVEVAFLEQVQHRMTRILFVLNKLDYLDDQERQAATAFLQRTLEAHLGFPAGTPILAVSARRGLLAAQQKDSAAWAASGLAQVQRMLLDFVTHEKARTLQLSLARKGVEVLEEVQLQLQLALQSLNLPLQDLKARLHVFEQKSQEIQQERILAEDLLAGDRKRAHAFLEAQAEELRQKARVHFLDLVRLELDARENASEADMQGVLADMIPSFFERELGTISTRFQERTEAVLNVHQGRADHLIEALRRTAAELFEVPYRAPAASGAFELKRYPYWVSREWTDALSPLNPAWVDRFLPDATRKRRILARLQKQIRMLVIRNVENLRWALYQSLDQSLQQFSARLDDRLEETILATRKGILSVLEKRKDAEYSSKEDVARCAAAQDDLAKLLAALESL